MDNVLKMRAARAFGVRWSFRFGFEGICAHSYMSDECEVLALHYGRGTVHVAKRNYDSGLSEDSPRAIHILQSALHHLRMLGRSV